MHSFGMLTSCKHRRDDEKWWAPGTGASYPTDPSDTLTFSCNGQLSGYTSGTFQLFLVAPDGHVTTEPTVVMQIAVGDYTGHSQSLGTVTVPSPEFGMYRIGVNEPLHGTFFGGAIANYDVACFITTTRHGGETWEPGSVSNEQIKDPSGNPPYVYWADFLYEPNAP